MRTAYRVQRIALATDHRPQTTAKTIPGPWRIAKFGFFCPVDCGLWTVDCATRGTQYAVRGTRRAQSTLEYALFVAVAASALAGMTVYVRRSIQANLKAIEDRINADAVPLPEDQNGDGTTTPPTGGDGDTGGGGGGGDDGGSGSPPDGAPPDDGTSGESGQEQLDSEVGQE